MSNHFEADEVDDLIPEHQEQGGFDLGALAAELTSGPKTIETEDESDEYTDPDAVSEDYDELAAYEVYQARRAEELGVTVDGEPIPEADPEALRAEHETAVRSTVVVTQRTLEQLNQQHLAQLAATQQRQLAALRATVPDFAEDPEAHTATMFAVQEAQLIMAEQQRQAKSEGEHLARTAADVLPFGLEAEREVKSTTPDYQAAVDYLHESIARNMLAQTPGTSRADVNRTQAMATLLFLQDCKAKGINPAKAMYETAVQFGFQGKGLGTVKPKAAPQGKPAPTMADVGAMSDGEFETYFKKMQQAGAPQFAYGGGKR
jgi:hypothetical protein